MLRKSLLVCIACLGLATLSFAGIPDLTNSTVVTAQTDTPVSIFCAPDGGGQAFTEARGSSGVQDATITVTLLDAGMAPVFLYPFEDLWLETSLGGLIYCTGGTTADASTDINGQTTWSLPLQAGGFSEYNTYGGAMTEFTKVMVNGVAMSDDLQILFNSSDLAEGITGPLVSDLTDAIAFTDAKDLWDYPNGPYQYEADAFFSGTYNLSDVIVFAGGLNVSCP